MDESTINPSNELYAMRVIKNVKAIRFSTPDEICRILECQPGDILEYMNDKDYKKLMQ